MSDKKELRGAGGWLQILIIGLLLGMPLYSAVHFFIILSEFENIATSVSHKAAYIVGFAVPAAIYMLSGIALWIRHKKSSVYLAVGALWLNGPVSLGYLAITAKVPGVPPFLFLLLSIAPALLSLYLFRSVRVRNTYFGHTGPAREDTAPPLPKDYRYKWSLYIIHSGAPKYFLDADSALTLTDYVISGFRNGKQPVRPWALALIFNPTHRHIVLLPDHFESDGDNITPLLMNQIAEIDPDYGVENGRKPVFSDAVTGKWLEMDNYQAYATQSAFQKFKSGLLDWGPVKEEADFTAVFNKIFDRKIPASSSAKNTSPSFFQKLATNARRDGRISSTYRASARKHANAFWVFLALSGILWAFLPWFFAVTAGALAAFCTVKSFISSRIAQHMEKLESRK